MKIAILIPTYNASKTVKQTLISVQQNIHENNHLNTVAIVCDDNSQDNTLEIVENSWYLHRSLLEIIPSNKNQGERENINRILKNVENNYDWFYIIHADDIAKEDWLSTIYHYSLLYKDAASIATSYDVLHLDGSIEIGENKEEVTMIRGNLTSIKSTLISGTWFHISGCAINANTLKKIGYFQKDLPQYGDMEYVLRILSNQLYILYIPKSLTIYRQTSTSVSSNSFKKHIDIIEFVSLIAHFKNYHSRTELEQHNLKFQNFLNKRIIKSVVTINLDRLVSALKIKKYVKGVLLKNQENRFVFPFLNILDDCS